MGVMNVKRSTQAFSKAEQNAIPKSDGANTMSATDLEKALGGQNVGDVLNKIVDPNWQDPSKKIRSTGNASLDKDAFFKLMLAQMKAQDPTNPMQSHEMAAQLAQFTSLEQLNNINATLESMKGAQTPSTNFQALAFIGKMVSGDSSKVNRAKGDTEHLLSFQLLGDAANVKVTVKDAAGNVVRKLDFASLKKGDNTVKWNGMTDDGLPARTGEYKIAIEAQSANGQKVYAKTEFGGRITGLNYTSEGPVLMVGSQTIKMSDVKKIQEAPPGESSGENAPMMNLAPQDQAKAAAGRAVPMAAMAAPLNPVSKSENANQDSKSVASNGTMKTSAPNASETDNVPPAEEPEPIGNIADVPMARELLDKVAKNN